MSEMTRYEPGTPSWVDLGADDPDAARAFYGELLGWDYEVGGEETGFYGIATVRGKRAAGVGGKMDQTQPTVWTTYLSTDDLDATTRRIAEAGGKILMDPMDVMDQGRMAIASDVTGAAFGLWQPGTHTGAEIVNEPGGFSWNELATRDLAAAVEFYTAVFGYTWEDVDTGEGGPLYKTFHVDGRSVGGVMQMNEMFPPDIPSYWGLYFEVADTDAAIATAERLGGSVQAPAMDTPFGRMAGLVDPQGAMFSINQQLPQE